MYEIQLHPPTSQAGALLLPVAPRVPLAAQRAGGLAVVVLAGVVLVRSACTRCSWRGASGLASRTTPARRPHATRRCSDPRRARGGAARTRQRQMALILGMPEETTEHRGAARAETEPSFAPAAQALQRGLALEAASQQLLTSAGELARFATANRSSPRACHHLPDPDRQLRPDLAIRRPALTVHEYRRLPRRHRPRGARGDAGGGCRRRPRRVRGQLSPAPPHALWRFGKVVVLSHHGGYLTVYRHLESITVRRGQQLRRASGWAPWKHGVERIAAPPLRGAGRA